MTCPVCRARRLIEIRVNVGGRVVTLHSCSKCDTRWWDEKGERIELSKVLDLATVRR